jgi:RNA polymerase sigma factor (sigma-70 family)
MTGLNRGTVLRQLDQLLREGTLAGLSDAELLERYLAGRDEAAFEAIVQTHGPMVLGLCRRMLHEPEDVHDAFQATFLVLVKKGAAIRERDLLSNWLYGVAYRVASRARRYRQRRRGREITAMVANLAAPAPSEPIELGELKPILDSELNRLPLQYRAAIVLCYLHGRTHEQAAASIGCPVGTVRSRLARGRDLLRKRLTRLGYAPSVLFLKPGVELPCGLFTEPVPQALLTQTVSAGLAFGATPTIPTGVAAASVLALTRGALTTMQLTQFKWLGLTILAALASAGGVIAVSQSTARDAQESPAQERPAAGDALLQKVEITEPADVKSVQPREGVLEQRIDRFLDDMGFLVQGGSVHGVREGEGMEAARMLKRKLVPFLNSLPEGAVIGTARPRSRPVMEEYMKKTPAVAPEPSAEPAIRPSPRNVSLMDPPDSASVARRSIRELEFDLQVAVMDCDHPGPPGLAIARGKVFRLVAMLEGQADELNEELDRLKLEKQKKATELVKAQSQREYPLSRLASLRRINARKPGMIADSDMQKTESELRAVDADVEIKKIEIKEVELHMSHIERRLEQIKRALQPADPIRNGTGKATPAEPDR